MTARAAPATRRAGGRIGAIRAEAAAPNSIAIVAKPGSAVALPAPAAAAAGYPAGELYERATARACATCRVDPIPGAITDDRHAPTTEIRENELPVPFVPDLAVRADHLDDELRFVDVDTVARGAREPVRTDFGRAGVIERFNPELLLDPLARGRDRGAGLSGVDGYAQGRPREIDAFFPSRLRESQRIRRRAHHDRRLCRDDRRDTLDRRHRAAGQAERAETLRARERRPETDEGPKREREEDAIARGDAGGAINGIPALPPPLPGLGGVEAPQRPTGC